MSSVANGKQTLYINNGGERLGVRLGVGFISILALWAIRSFLMALLDITEFIRESLPVRHFDMY